MLLKSRHLTLDGVLQLTTQDSLINRAEINKNAINKSVCKVIYLFIYFSVVAPLGRYINKHKKHDIM